MSFLIFREFDNLYNECISQGWISCENTEDTVRLVSPGHLAEIRIVLFNNNQIQMSVPIRCEGDPHATQYTTHHDDVDVAARFGEMHMYNHTLTSQ